MLHASCHCGAVRLDITRRPRTVTECNCSICRRYAARWAYYSGNAVRVIARPGAMQVYAYKRKTYAYYHCLNCGCVTHYRRDGTADDSRIAVNTRMMELADIADVPVRAIDVTRRPR